MLKSDGTRPASPPELVEALDRTGVKVISPVEAARKLDIDPKILILAHQQINAMLAFAQSPAGQRLYEQCLSGRIGDTPGFDWYYDAEIK